MKWVLVVFFFFTSSGLVSMAQNAPSGPVILTITDLGTDCSGMARVCSLQADVSGLVGSSGAPVGLNSFVLVFSLNGPAPSDVFGSAQRGEQSDFSWGFQHTDPSLVDLHQQMTLVGWSSFSDPPSSTVYELARIYLSGLAQDVTISMDLSKSSMATRFAGPGDGPAAIDIQPAGPWIMTIPENMVWQLSTAYSDWQTANPDFDLMPPHGVINVSDFIKLVICGAYD